MQKTGTFIGSLCCNTTHTFSVLLDVKLKADAIREYVRQYTNGATYGTVYVALVPAGTDEIKYTITCPKAEHIPEIREAIGELERHVLDVVEQRRWLDMIAENAR